MSRLLLALRLAVIVSAAAPAAAAPAAPDAARMAAAGRLLDALHYDELTDRTVEAMIAEAQKTFPKQVEERIGQPLPIDLRDKLFAAIAGSIRHAMSENRANLRRGTAMIYASRFTEPEIEHLIAIQKDPVMVKMQAEVPQIMTESAALGSAAVQSELPRMTRAIEQIVKDYYAAGRGKPGA